MRFSRTSRKIMEWAALEDLRVLDAKARQAVDVEEAAVVDVARGDAPIGQPVGLRFEDPVQRGEALRAPGAPLTRERARSIACRRAGRARRPRRAGFSASPCPGMRAALGRALLVHAQALADGEFRTADVAVRQGRQGAVEDDRIVERADRKRCSQCQTLKRPRRRRRRA